MIAQIFDKTADYTGATPVITLDIGQYEHLSIDVAGVTGTINITGTNDSGAVQGVTDGNATTATNFTAVQAIPLATGTAATTITADGLYKIDPVSFKFLRLSGAGSTVTKLIIFANKQI